MTADERNPTIGDIARMAGVSPMTVSRVINGGARVSAATRERVQAVIDAAGYVPDPAARILARAGAGRIGLLYANPSNAYLAEVLSGALAGARAAGLLLMIEPSQAGDPAQEADAVRRLAAGGAQGLIVPPPLGESPATLDAVAQTLSAHQYPDGFALYLGTMFAPVEDRDEADKGFTHKVGDRVRVSSEKLGVLENIVTTCDQAPPWTMGVSALMRNLAGRGLLGGAA